MGCFELSWAKGQLRWKWLVIYFLRNSISIIFWAVTATLLFRSLTFFMVKFFCGDEDDEWGAARWESFSSPMTREELNCVILMMLLFLLEDCALRKALSLCLRHGSLSCLYILMGLAALGVISELSNRISTRVLLCIIFCWVIFIYPCLRSWWHQIGFRHTTPRTASIKLDCPSSSKTHHCQPLSSQIISQAIIFYHSL